MRENMQSLRLCTVISFFSKIDCGGTAHGWSGL